MSERERLIGENEALWRRINEIAPPEAGVMNTVFCECGNVGCREQVLVTADEYQSVRSTPTTFLVAAGHELPQVETVVRANERFLVVDKDGEAAVVAERTDPRS